jgi:hypothetical protein
MNDIAPINKVFGFQGPIFLGNTKMKKEAHLYIRFQLANSFGNTKMKKDTHFIYSLSTRQFIWEY